MNKKTEQVVSLKCNHQFHFECVLGHMSEGSAGNNTCAICRASIDAKQKDDKGIYGINWLEAWKEEVDLLMLDGDRLFVEADGPDLMWPMLRDTIAGLGWEREEVKPVTRRWKRHGSKK
jgi:hypothetical protein